MASFMGDEKKISGLYRRFKYAQSVRDTRIIPEWESLSKYLSPAHGRFLTRRDNIPAKQKVDRTNIINNTATRAKAIAVAGIKGGLVPHSLKWFKYGLYDEDLAKFGPVREWMASVESVIYSVMNRSNFYESIYLPFDEQISFGTGPYQINEHPDRVIHCDPWTVGEYALMNGGDRTIDTGFREYWVTLRSLAIRFGEKSLSARAQGMMKNNPDQYIKVINAIMPREDYDSNKLDKVNMPTASVWFEAVGTDQNQILSESGYLQKPVMYPRWITIGEDAYGSDCPGMMNLGDIKQLQRMEIDKLRAQALEVRPPMNVPTKLYGMLKMYPDAQNAVSKDDSETIKRTIDNRPNINGIRQEIRDVEMRIKEGFFNDLFLMLLNSERSGTTAFEIAKKNEEKLVLLGPVVERQNSELLTPAHDRIFDICMRRGMFPEPPEELDNQDIKIEYSGLLAQAQKAVGVGGIERTVSFVGSMSELYPEARHKIKPLDTVDEFAELAGMSPKLIRSDDEAAQRYSEELQQQQQAAQAQQMIDGAGAAKSLAGAELPDGDNMLNRVINQLPAV